MARRVLLTAAQGVGLAPLCQALLAGGDEVWALDRSGAVPVPGVRAVIGDLAHPESLEALPRDWDGVVHLPGEVGDTPREALRPLERTLGLLAHLRAGRLVVLSGSRIPEGDDGDGAALDPGHPEGRRALGWQMVEAAARAASGRLEVCLLRTSLALGPGSEGPLADFARDLGRGRTGPWVLPVAGGVRDVLDGRDLAAALQLLLEAEAPGPGPFLACTGVGTDLGELLREAAMEAGAAGEVLLAGPGPRGEVSAAGVGTPTALQALGWQPCHSAREALGSLREAEAPRPSLPPLTFPLAGKRLWVTGGHGFLGRHVVAALQREGAEVLAPRSRELDLLDPGAARRYLAEVHPDGVVHLAARVGGIGANRRQPGTFFHDNMAMGLHLIEACREAAVAKLLVAGTVCAYPKHCPVPFREEELWEGYPEETNAPYGIAKKALLVQLQGYRQEFGLRGIFLLPVNLYGPGDHLDLQNSHVIPALIRKFLEAKRAGRPSVELWGTGRASREFLFVEDAARGLCEALSRYEDPEPVNLGTGQEISIRDLAELLKRLTGFQGELVFNPDHPDGQPRRQLDVRRARTRFGWEAQVSFEEGLRRTLAWVEAGLA